MLDLRSIISGFFKGHERSVKAKRNIASSFVIKGLNVGLSIILVPITLEYLNPTKYGIWLTISSVIAWFDFFDIGLGHGLRNHFAIALAHNKKKLARIYVSTSYALLSIIMGILSLIFIFAYPFINWTKIFNADQALSQELSLLIMYVFAFFALRFVFRLISVIVKADQRPSLGMLLELISKSMSFIIIVFLARFTDSSLLYLGIAFSISPVIVFLVASIFFYSTRYKDYAPTIKSVKFQHSNKLLNLGLKFFLIQISVIVMFSTDNIIISQLFGPEEVTPYNIAHKYLNILFLAFSIIVTPFWSAFTDAWSRKDIPWIKNIIKKLNRIWIVFLVLDIIMVISANWIYDFWVGDIKIPFKLTFFMGLYFIVRIYGSIYNNFINGVGKIKLQLMFSIIATIINIPLSIFFAKTLNMGITGVITATLVCISYGPFIAPLQYKKIINNKATGIWNK